MLHIVTGGSASGKSAYAEDLICKEQKEEGSLYYIATMIPQGEETKRKIERHKRMRKNKGFISLECYTNLYEFVKKSQRGLWEGKAFVLLECMSNLVANELYEKRRTGEEVVATILRGICHLNSQCECMVVVTNEVFSDSSIYSEEMNYYKQILGEINCRITEMADEVTEVVSGMAQKIKGKTNVSGRKSFAPGIKLIIGGEYQGKRAFATKRYGIGSLEDGASCSKETLYGCEGIYHFEIFIKRMMDERENISIILDKIIEENPEIVIISTEIGMGLVPINKVERLYREQVGRICTELAKKAVCVTRVICGIGITLKEEEIEG